MRVAIRTDASLDIGTGHVMRCLTLALALRSKGAEVIFVCRDFKGALHEKLQAIGFQVSILPHNDLASGSQAFSGRLRHHEWLGDDERSDASDTLLILQKERAFDWLVTDHYGIGKIWHQTIRPANSKIFVIDDLADREHDCDLLLDQSYFGKHKLSRYVNKVPPHCKTLIGPNYSLLRPEFNDQVVKPSAPNNPIRKLFINFGGIDKPDMTSRVLETLLPVLPSGVSVDVVASNLNPQLEKIARVCQEHQLSLHIDSDEMAGLMRNADLAIGCGGVVAIERAFIRLPSIVIANAFNQQKSLQDMASSGLVSLLDNIDQLPACFGSMLKNGAPPVKAVVKNGTQSVIKYMTHQ